MNPTHSSAEQVWDTFGYIPGVSTITGAKRAASGISSLVEAGLDVLLSRNQSRAKGKACNGAYQIGRGLLEMVPVAGNLTCFVIDTRNGINALPQRDTWNPNPFFTSSG
jgi:hypothetical protein